MDLVQFLKRYKLTILIVLAAFVIFIIAAYIAYTYIIPKKRSKEGYSNDNVNLIMFHVDWCPYCKTALPIFEKIRGDYDGTTVNNKKLRIISLDATDENSISEDFGGKTVGNIISQFTLNSSPFNIEGYPTIILSDSNNRIIAEFDKTTTYENIDTFINSNL